MHNQVAALIVSGRLENKQKLTRILEALPTNLFIVGTLAHAQEVLSEQPISIVFCDERLFDGPYSELVTFAKSRHMGAHFIVMLTTGEWPEFLEALGLGAEVVRCPLQPTDVELALIHAMRREQIEPLARRFSVSA